MPTYEYVCEACDHEFELFQQMSASVKRKCPECGELKLRRRFGTGAGIIFKGGGFYETDYRSESYKKAAEADRKAAEGGSSDKKSDEKKTSAKDKDAKKPASGQSNSKKQTAAAS
jgi:putative FmdB family regulatory protein